MNYKIDIKPLSVNEAFNGFCLKNIYIYHL